MLLRIDYIVLKNGLELDNKYLQEYQKLISKREAGSLDSREIEILKELYTQYWKPFKKKLEGITKVYLSVDGVFNKINLNTLINPETLKKYVIEEMDIRYVTNTENILDKEQIIFGTKKVELFANPYYNVELNLDTLKNTETEIEFIESVLLNTGMNVEIKKYINYEATETNVKKVQSPYLLHIGTHGFFKYGEQDTTRFNAMLNSGLYLSEGMNISQYTIDNTNDGILTAYEVSNMNLDNTKLVTLSACETAKGLVLNGEGVYGLQRAFKVAGVENIMMSLWKVQSYETRILMQEFYKNWFIRKSKESANIYDALKKSQLEMIQHGDSFFFWGGFIIST